jgi:glycosyltransferase involved in cell wall biosynthesis
VFEAEPESPNVSAHAEPALSVVVIAYNEALCLLPVVRELHAALARAGIDCELVLVDDGSSDATLEHMRILQRELRQTQVLALSPNRGIGGALRAGFDAARGHHVTWVPADGQIAPESVVELFHARERAPMITTVYRSRADAWYRHAVSKSLNALIALQTGQQAKSGGNYIFDRRLWLRHAPRGDDTMMLSTAFRHNLRAAGERIEELAIDARPRVAGQSKVLNPKTIARTLGRLLRM